MIGPPHCDGGKTVTALLSERETLSTEIYTGKKWVKLPLSSDRLAIFPSAAINRSLDISPTLHRILVNKRIPVEEPQKRNITLLLTVRPL